MPSAYCVLGAAPARPCLVKIMNLLSRAQSNFRACEDRKHLAQTLLTLGAVHEMLGVPQEDKDRVAHMYVQVKGLTFSLVSLGADSFLMLQRMTWMQYAVLYQ